MIGDAKPADFVDRLRVRKERGGMTIVTHAQRDEVERGRLRTFELHAVAQVAFIAVCGFLGVEFTFHAEDIRLGDRHLAQ